MNLNTPLKLVFLVLALIIASQQLIHSQKKFSIVEKVEGSDKNFSVSSGIDFSPIKISPHVCFNIDNRIGIGLELGLGVNFTNFRLVAGSHFAGSSTPIVYADRDNNGGIMFRSYADFSIFTRLNLHTKKEIDIGLHGFVFIHSVTTDDDFGGGYFVGTFVRYMIPTNFKLKNDKIKRRISGGIQITVGSLNEFSVNEFLVMSSLIGRVYFNYSKFKK